MSQYGGVGMDDIRRWRQMPLVTAIRLLACMRQRLYPQSGPVCEADSDKDAAIVAMLEEKRKQSERNNQV